MYSFIAIIIQIFWVIKYPQVGSNRGKGKVTIPNQRFVILLLQVIPILILIITTYCDSEKIANISKLDFIRYLGLFFFIIGFCLTNWSEIVLDKQFSVEVTIQEHHELITYGPFKYLRHPRYLGIILFTLGIIFLFNSLLPLTLEFLLIIVLMWRISDEENLMQVEFGERWEFYKKNTWRIISFIY